MQEETSEAMDVIRLKGGISFAGVKDIRSAIMRLKIGEICQLSSWWK